MRTVRSSTLSCGFQENDLIAEALGEAPSHLSLRIRTHLLSCTACAAMLEQYRTVRVQLHVLVTHEDLTSGVHAARRALDQRLLGSSRPRLVLDVWRSPVGDIRIGKTDKGVVLTEFVRPDGDDASVASLHREFAIESGGQEIADLIQTLEDYFSGKRRSLEWSVDDTLMRSDFQREVLRATAEVPYGTVVTYLSIAEAIGQPKAVRAVAQALRHNPVPIQIPCHRVIGSDGNLTGYAGNLVDIKKQILAVEGIPVVETAKGFAIPKAQMYVGWRHDRCFCRPDCASLKDQLVRDRTFIPSRSRAEEMGYAPCDVCHPEQYPL
jgi:methylated-DNA-[protein]-cysteine S-methyltransferase